MVTSPVRIRLERIDADYENAFLASWRGTGVAMSSRAAPSIDTDFPGLRGNIRRPSLAAGYLAGLARESQTVGNNTDNFVVVGAPRTSRVTHAIGMAVIQRSPTTTTPAHESRTAQIAYWHKEQADPTGDVAIGASVVRQLAWAALAPDTVETHANVSAMTRQDDSVRAAVFVEVGFEPTVLNNGRVLWVSPSGWPERIAATQQ